MKRFVHNKWSHAGTGQTQPTGRRRFGIGAKPTPEPHSTKCHVPGHIARMTKRAREQGTQATISRLQNKLKNTQSQNETLLAQLEMAREQLQTARSTLEAKYKLIDELLKTPAEDAIIIKQWTDKYKRADDTRVRLSSALIEIARTIVRNNRLGRRKAAFQKIAEVLLDSEPIYTRDGKETFSPNLFSRMIGEFENLPKIAKKTEV